MAGPAYTARVEGLERLKAKVLDQLPQKVKDAMKRANQQNAKEFESLVRSIVPRGDPANGALVATLETKDVGEVATSVSIGSKDLPYVLHLEAGHRNKDGSHTPAKPRNRVSRAAAKALKSLSTPGAAK